jgi:hypothetical protein
MMDEMVSIQDLKLGDVVETCSGPYGAGIVKRITPTEVTVVRVYMTTEDFSFGDEVKEVIVYTGYEEIRYMNPRTIQFRLLLKTRVKA